MFYLYGFLAVALFGGGYYVGYKFGYKVAADELKVVAAVKSLRKVL